ncbi:hypothetical protein ABZ705_32835 [Streptomyces sp. NPDC006984]|uniref:hypothetical protein n=1 Tax=Streptomyces sp. NPDC006984 TaxID=3155463 RepID=UPI00340F8033
MSKPPRMEDLMVKFHSNRAGVYRGETAIWQAPEGSLYRVVQRLDPAEFEIASLVPTGWITLLTLHKEVDGVADQDEPLAGHPEPSPDLEQRLGGRARDRSMTASAESGLTLDDVLDLSTALDLVDAKIELLSEYKLEYPQDYTPDDIRSMNDEVEQLHQLPHATDGPASPPGSRVLRLRRRRCPDRLMAIRASNQARYAAVPPCWVVTPAG